MTDKELLALGEAIYNAQPSDLDGGAPLHDHPRREAILRAWAAALTKAVPQPVLTVTADENGSLLIACGKQNVTLPLSALVVTLAGVAGNGGNEAASKAAPAIDRALRKNAAAASYATDAKDIARVLVRHYGDEAEAVIDLLPSELVHARIRGKR